MKYIICTTNQKVSKETSAKTIPTNNKNKGRNKDEFKFQQVHADDDAHMELTDEPLLTFYNKSTPQIQLNLSIA